MHHGGTEDTEISSRNRIPGASRDPPPIKRAPAGWVRAFAGNADFSNLRDLRASVVLRRLWLAAR
jgi:hypothetical protein